MPLGGRVASTGIDLHSRYRDVVRVDSVNGLVISHARDPATGRYVVIKAAGRTAPRARDMLEREAAVLSILGAHPNVQTMYERMRLRGGGVALALERCVGSFREVFTHQPVPVQNAVSLGVQLAGALETAHRAGFVHGGVDPANLAVTEWSEPVLTNFGAAVDRSGASLTFDVPNVHTAPEILLGESIGPATDVYGLASVLYELIAHRPAIVASGGSAAVAVSASVLCSSVAPVLGPDVPLDLSDLLVWSLAADPLGRPPSAIWIGEELRRIEKAAGWERTPMTIGAADL